MKRNRQHKLRLKAHRRKKRRSARRRWLNALLDQITSIDPWDTPFNALLPRITLSQIYDEWHLDELKKES